MAKRRSSRRKQADISNGTGGANSSGSAVTEAATSAAPEDNASATADTPPKTGTDSSTGTGSSPEPFIAETVTAGEELLQRLQTALADLDGKLAAADRTLESLAEGIDFPEILGETLENLQTTVDQLKQQLPEAVRYNTESIVALHAQVAELETSSAQSSLGDGAREGATVDEAAIAELRARIQDLDNQLTDESSGELRQAISECQQRIETELQTRERLDAEVRSQLLRLEEQLAEPASLPTEILELPDTLKALQATVDELDNRKEPSSATEDIEASIRSLQSATESLEAQFAEAIANRSDEDWQPVVSELTSQLEGLQQQLPEAVSLNMQSIVSLTDQLAELDGALKHVTEASEGDENKAAIAQLEQSLATVNEQLTDLDGALKVVAEASAADESQVAIAQLQQSVATVEEQMQQALAATELVEGLQTAQQSLQQSLEARIQEAVELIDQHPSAEQFSELQNRVESGKRVGSLEALIRRAEELEQKPTQPPTWEVDLEEMRKSVELLSRRIPEAYQLNSETTARLGEQIDALQEQVTQLADRPQPTVTPEILETLQAAIAELQTAQGELKTQLEAIPEAPEEPTDTADNAETEDIRAAITQLTDQLVSLSQKLPEAVKYNTQSIVGLQEQLAGLERSGAEQGNRSGAVSANPADDSEAAKNREPVSDSQVSGAIAQLEAQLAKAKAAEERLEMMEISYDDIDKRMDVVDLKVGSRASAEELQEVRADLATRADAQELEQALGQLQELKDAIEHPAPLWQEDVDEIRARLDAVVAQLPEVIQFNTDTAVQLDTQVSTLQQQLTALQEDDETAVTIARLQEQLTTLQDSLDTQGSAGELVEDTLRSLGQDVAQLSDRLEQMSVQERLREEESARDEAANPEPWREELEAIAVRLQETVATVEQQRASVSELEQRIGQPLEAIDADVIDAEVEVESAEIENDELEEKAPSEALVQLRTDVDALQPILEKSFELETQLSTFATTLYALQSTITPLEQQLPEALRYNTQSVVELHEQMDELRAQVQEFISSEAETSETESSDALAIAQELDTVRSQYEQLQAQVERVQTELRESQSADTISANTIAEELGAVQTESRGLRDQMEILGVRLQQAESLGLENELAALQTECRGLQGQLETIRARAESTATGAVATQSALEDLQADYRQLQGNYRQLQDGWERDRNELTQLRQTLSELEGTVADKSDSSAIAPIQTELNNLLALHERQNQQAQQEQLQEEFALLNSQFVQLEQQLPEAIRLNTQSIITLQEKETQFEGDVGTQVEELRAEVEGLLAQQQSLKVWLISTVGVALVALAAAVVQVLGWQIGA